MQDVTCNGIQTRNHFVRKRTLTQSFSKTGQIIELFCEWHDKNTQWDTLFTYILNLL